MNINQKFIPASNTFTRPGIKMNPEYITIHETDNTAKGANDEAHARLQYNGNSRQASWHFQVDEDSIYQSLPTNEVGWHAGDGRGPGNMKSIGIEICVNSDGDFKKAVENAVWLVQYLMDQHNIPASKVVQHNNWSGKNCPRYLRSGDKGITWNDFLNKVKGGESSSKPVEGPKPSKTESKPNNSAAPTKTDNLGLVDWMKSKGMDSSMTNRKKLAKQYGIKNYSGKAEQNTSLLAKLKAGKPSEPKKETKPASKPKTKKVYLPASDPSWRVYPTNKAPVKGNEKGYLNPKKFGGLSYEILGSPQKDVYTIKTDDFGTVNIYAAPSTGAKIK
ncbi:hypothetical protein B5V89_16530 [Heyndrickxia sporothermodurans]|uniref:N-acetylmuramoyl-L-alanine amidase n=1 Tax=Heyndrickxia TaxID=2837504 RepID=UPI000D39B7C3|nr:N-acetylmuramoyl-L-alanine amidase [Heyndrickxia sporothermodurans]PTY76934.1 hypothetical protein B5V89_16530 [Heyndrickxia sporothermodurans]